MDDNGVIWNNSDLYNMNPAANVTNTTNLTDTIPLTGQLRQQLINFPQTTDADGNTTGGAVGGILVSTAENTTETTYGDTTKGVFSLIEGSGFSPVPHEREPVNLQHTDYTE